MTEQTIEQGQSGEHGGLISLFALIWRRKGVAAATFAIIIVSSVIAVLVVTPKFTARATFIPPSEDTGGIASVLRDPLSAFTGKGGGATVDRLVGFLDSETARRSIVKRFDLMSHYRAELMADALIELETSTRATVTPEGVITVDVTDEDPELAADIANAYVAITDSLYAASQTQHAGQTRRFMEERLAENQRQMAAAEEAAQAFGEEYGVVSLPEQIAVLVEQVAMIDAQISELDTRIGAARQILGSRHSSVVEMEIERSQLVSQRRNLMEANGKNPDGDPLLTMGNIPERSVEYFRLQREIEIQTIIQELLYRQYEMAKLDEARTVSTIVPVDRATVPELKSWPMRKRIVIISAAMGIVWAVLMAWFVENGPQLARRITGADRA